jgi:hypothetical protein
MDVLAGYGAEIVAEMVAEMVVWDGKVVTCAGVLAGITTCRSGSPQV